MANEVKISLEAYNRMRDELIGYRKAVEIRKYSDFLEATVDITAWKDVIREQVEENYPDFHFEDYWEDRKYASGIIAKRIEDAEE